MQEYHILRFVLCVLEFSVAFLIVRRDVGHLYAWVFYCGAAGVADLIPALLGNPHWARYVWAPLRLLLLVLLARAAADAWRYVMPHTERSERLLVAAVGFVAGGVLVAGWLILWRVLDMAPAADWFQVFGRFRELAVLGLAGGFSTVWFCWRRFRPVSCTPIVRRHLCLLGAWLWAYWIGATMVKGCSLWLVTPWEGGGDVWRWVNAGVMGAQVLLMVGWAWNLWVYGRRDHQERHGERRCIIAAGANNQAW